MPITVDANVICYEYGFRVSGRLPDGARIERLADFCVTFNQLILAYNQKIKSEYSSLLGQEYIKNMLAKRLQMGLAIEVEPLVFSRSELNILRDEYGFDIRSNDIIYLETTNNTLKKILITENTKDFFRFHRSSRRRICMRRYLQNNYNIRVLSVDEYQEGCE